MNQAWNLIGLGFKKNELRPTHKHDSTFPTNRSKQKLS